MRTIELVEYEPAQAHLAPHELEQVLASGVVAVAPLPVAGAYELRAGSVVGTVVLPDLRLLIRTKVGLANLFFLLGCGAGITRWVGARFPYEREPDLLEAVAWVFAAAVADASAHGIARGYAPREAALGALRGRIDTQRQVGAHHARPFPLACRFEEYTEDVQLNQVLRVAHDRLLSLPRLDADVARRLHASRRAFGAVAPTSCLAAALPDLRFTRLDQHWEEAYRLACLILQQQSLRDRTGAVAGIAFTVDVNRLFERLVEHVFREAARQAGWQLEAQARRYLAAQMPVVPDFVLRRDGRDLAVADAKYREPDGAGADHADLYQLLAYCVALGLPAGLLVYAAPRPLTAYSVQRARVGLEVTGVDLRAPPAAIRGQLHAAAARLIDQAQRTLHQRRLTPAG